MTSEAKHQTASPNSDPRPRVRGNVTEHYWLAQRMAKAANIDLVTAFQSGALTSDEWADFIHRCQTCPWSQGCKKLLDQSFDHVPDVPTTCENHSFLTRLSHSETEDS